MGRRFRIALMIVNSRVLGVILLGVVAVCFVVPRAMVGGQYSNGPSMWIDFQVLNQTKHLQLSGLNNLLVTEALDLTIDTSKHQLGVASMTMSGAGGYHIGESATTTATFWTGDNNRTISSIDYNLLSISSNGATTTSQTIHIFNVPGAVAFSLSVTYAFESKGNYEVEATLNLPSSNVQNSISMQVTYP